jgi:branched-chain amino acid transport system permease protein
LDVLWDVVGRIFHPQVLILGFLIGSLYALVAVGFTMIFGVAGVLNLAHGAFVMIGAYLAIWAFAILKWSLPVAFALAILGVAVLAPLVYRVLIRPIEDRPVTVFLATLLLAVVLEQVVILLFSANPRTDLPPMIPGGFVLWGTNIPYNRLLAGGVALAVIGMLWVFVTRTQMGKAILALSMERKGAALAGIPTERITFWVWVISGALAALAGLFTTSFLGIRPFEERVFLVIAFSTVVLGGLGSIPGSLWAAFIIGYAETIAQVFAPEARGFASLVILLTVLILRPQGLFGRAAA